jgi:hypothetical protein
MPLNDLIVHVPKNYSELNLLIHTLIVLTLKISLYFSSNIYSLISCDPQINSSYFSKQH